MRKILILLALTMALAGQATAQTSVNKTDTIVKTDSTASSSKVGFAISFNLGGGLAVASGGAPDLSKMGYPSMVNSSMSNYQYNSAGGINIGFDLDLLFGKKQNLGLSAGLTFANSYTRSEADGFHTEYMAHDGNGNTYRRLVTANQVNESLSFINLMVPLLFKYRTNPDQKLGAFIEIGPVLSLLSSASSSMDGSVDFEGVYHYDQPSKNFTYSPTTQPGDWLITRQAVAAQIAGSDQYSSVNDYFVKHYARGYYVGLDVPEKAKAQEKIKYRVGMGGLLRGGGIYRVNKKVNVLFGVSMMLISNSRDAGSYTPLDAQDDFVNNFKFSSFLNGTSSLLTIQMGLNVGVQIKLSK